MRIVHTSDWHAGRVWKGISRLDELAATLENLGDFLERERIDLLMVSGDLFDHGAPAAEAERLVFSFFRRMGRAGVRTALIAGNHDSPVRTEAWATLAELVEVRAVPRPVRMDRGGVLELESRAGERVILAALPFAPPRALVRALDIVDDAALARWRYAEGMQRMLDHLCGAFRDGAINLLMAHTHLEGARFSGSERAVHIGSEWAALPQALPAHADYVALGHIHCPQAVESSASPTRYAGSVLQLDFGEVGQEKSVVVIDVRPDQPAHIELVPCRGGRPLEDVYATLAQLERDAHRYTNSWVRVTVPLAEPDPDITRKVRRMVPTAVVVKVELPEAKDAPRSRSQGLSPKELFSNYFRAEHGRDPEPELIDTFGALHESQEADR